MAPWVSGDALGGDHVAFAHDAQDAGYTSAHGKFIEAQAFAGFIKQDVDAETPAPAGAAIPA